MKEMMKQSYASIKEIVEFGLDNIPEEQLVTVNLRDFMYIHQVLQEYMRFFHQPDHYRKIEDVLKFLGTQSSGGGFEVLNTAVYEKLCKMKLPEEIEKMIENDIFEHSLNPSYYSEK